MVFVHPDLIKNVVSTKNNQLSLFLRAERLAIDVPYYYRIELVKFIDLDRQIVFFNQYFLKYRADSYRINATFE